jgi:O-antigen/teichoic acid export membrane protein
MTFRSLSQLRLRLPDDTGAIVHTTSVRLLGLLSGLITLSLTARWLGPEGRGTAAGATAWATLIAGLCHLSIAQVVIRDAAVQADQRAVSRLVASVLTLGMIGVAVAWLCVGVLYLMPLTPVFGALPAAPLAIAMLMVPWLVIETYASSLLPALGALRSLNAAQLFARGASLLLLLLCVPLLRFGVLGAMFATVGGLSVGGILMLRRMVRDGHGPIQPANREAMSRLLRSGSLLHLNAVGSVLLSNIDVIVVQQSQSAAATGVYQLAVQAAMLPLMMPQAAATVFYGRVARLGVDAGWRHSRRAVIAVLCVVAIGAGLGAVLAPWVVGLLAGARFAGAVPFFRVLLLGTFAQSFSAMMAPQWIGRGYFRTASAITLFLGVATMVLLRHFVPLFGLRGAVAIVVGAHCVTALVNLGFVAWIQRRMAAESGAGQ